MRYPNNRFSIMTYGSEVWRRFHQMIMRESLCAGDYEIHVQINLADMLLKYNCA